MHDVKGRIHSVVPVALALCALSGCAGAWQRATTKHFTLYTDADFDHVETLRTLEYSYAALASSFFKGNDIGRVDVLLLDDVPFIGALGNFRDAAAMATVPGAKIGQEGLIVLRPMRYDPTRGVSPVMGMLAGTEMLAHIFIQRTIPNAPLWFHEGFAKYARNLRFNQGEDGRAVGCFGFLGAVDTLLPVSEIVAATWTDYADKHRRWLPLSSYVLIDWILHADGGARRHKLGPMVEALYTGKSSSDALVLVADGGQLGPLDDSLRLHQQRISHMDPRGLCPLPFGIDPYFAPDINPPRMQDQAPEEIDALIAAIEKLPQHDGYPPYYPLDVIQKGASKR